MGLFELFILAIGVSMDAFAVSICRGLKLQTPTYHHSLESGFYFGGFQALMPLIGYFIGSQFYDLIKHFDHWVAFILLGYLGAKMLKDAFTHRSEPPKEQPMIILAIATSIDALAIGVSLALLSINIWIAALFIGIITFCFSAVGIQLGALFGNKFQAKSEILGGIILMGLGIKILVTHLFF